MKLRKGHRGIDDMTDEEAVALAAELYAEECADAEETETPPEYVDEYSSPIAARILEDLADDSPLRKQKGKRRLR